MSARKKERFTTPRNKSSTSERKKAQNARILLAKNRREKNPQLPAKQGESRDVTFPRHTHVPLSPPKARAKPFSLRKIPERSYHSQSPVISTIVNTIASEISFDV
jgi:hypothetical protein